MQKLMSILMVAGILTLGGLNIVEAQGPYINGGVAGPNAVLGWNFFNPTFCLVTPDGFLYIYVSGGGIGWTNNPAIIASVAPACQTANAIGIHITRLVPFLWDYAAIYSFR